jgi:DNA polymerase I
MKTHVLIDSPNLLYRAFYTTGNLRNGVVFGFFKQIVTIVHRFNPHTISFCFDSGKSKREIDFPAYKQHRRKERTEEDKRSYKRFRKQLRFIRDRYLEDIGFRNVFYQSGFEADDLIASLAEQIPMRDEAIIVSSDHDFFQCLSGQVKIWNQTKQQFYTVYDLIEEFGVHPNRWSDIKALAGCPTDGIPGIPGVGEKTAAKWCCGEISEKSKIHTKILEGHDIFERNIQLVKLPYEGVKKFKIRSDKVTVKKWKRFCRELEMDTLIQSPPISRGQFRRGLKWKRNLKN